MGVYADFPPRGCERGRSSQGSRSRIERFFPLPSNEYCERLSGFGGSCCELSESAPLQFLPMIALALERTAPLELFVPGSRSFLGFFLRGFLVVCVALVPRELRFSQILREPPALALRFLIRLLFYFLSESGQHSCCELFWRARRADCGDSAPGPELGSMRQEALQEENLEELE